MRAWLFLLVGILAMLVGVVWTLQGLDVVGGSAMSGNAVFAVVGPIVAIVGLIVAVAGVRGLRRSGAPPSV